MKYNKNRIVILIGLLCFGLSSTATATENNLLPAQENLMLSAANGSPEVTRASLGNSITRYSRYSIPPHTLKLLPQIGNKSLTSAYRTLGPSTEKAKRQSQPLSFWQRWMQLIKPSPAIKIKNIGTEKQNKNVQPSGIIFNSSGRALQRKIKKEKIKKFKTPSFFEKGKNYIKSFFVRLKTPKEQEIEKKIAIIAQNKEIYLTPPEKDYITKNILDLNSVKSSTDRKKFLLKNKLYPQLYDVNFGPVEIDKTVSLKEETLAGHPDVQNLLEKCIEEIPEATVLDKKILLQKINTFFATLNNNIDNVINTYIQNDQLLKNKSSSLPKNSGRDLSSQKIKPEKQKVTKEELLSTEILFEKGYKLYKKNDTTPLIDLCNNPNSINNQILRRRIVQYIIDPIVIIESSHFNANPIDLYAVISNAFKDSNLSKAQVLMFTDRIRSAEYFDSYTKLMKIKNELTILLNEKNQDSKILETVKHKLKVILIGLVTSIGFEKLHKIFSV